MPVPEYVWYFEPAVEGMTTVHHAKVLSTNPDGTKNVRYTDNQQMHNAYNVPHGYTWHPESFISIGEEGEEELIDGGMGSAR